MSAFSLLLLLAFVSLLHKISRVKPLLGAFAFDTVLLLKKSSNMGIYLKTFYELQVNRLPKLE